MNCLMFFKFFFFNLKTTPLLYVKSKLAGCVLETMVKEENLSETILHVVEVYFTKKNWNCVFFFDTSGNLPTELEHIEFVKKNSKHCLYMPNLLLSQFRNACGQYTITFLRWIHKL